MTATNSHHCQHIPTPCHIATTTALMQGQMGLETHCVSSPKEVFFIYFSFYCTKSLFTGYGYHDQWPPTTLNHSLSLARATWGWFYWIFFFCIGMAAASQPHHHKHTNTTRRNTTTTTTTTTSNTSKWREMILDY